MPTRNELLKENKRLRSLVWAMFLVMILMTFLAALTQHSAELRVDAYRTSYYELLNVTKHCAKSLDNCVNYYEKCVWMVIKYANATGNLD